MASTTRSSGLRHRDILLGVAKSNITFAFAGFLLFSTRWDFKRAVDKPTTPTRKTETGKEGKEKTRCQKEKLDWSRHHYHPSSRYPTCGQQQMTERDLLDVRNWYWEWDGQQIIMKIDPCPSPVELSFSVDDCLGLFLWHFIYYFSVVEWWLWS